MSTPTLQPGDYVEWDKIYNPQAGVIMSISSNGKSAFIRRGLNWEGMRELRYITLPVDKLRKMNK